MAFKSEKMPLVSILFPLLDDAEATKDSIEACLAQRYPNLETIIVDNGAGTASTEIGCSYGPRVRVVQIPQKVSAWAARTIGLSHAFGEFILFHESDAQLFPDRLWQDIEFATQPRTDIVISLDRWLREGEPLSFNPEPVCRRERRLLRSMEGISGDPQQALIALLQYGGPQHSCVLYRTSIVRALARYSDGTEIYEERELLFRALCRGATAVLNPRVTSARRFYAEKESRTSSQSTHESVRRLELAKHYAIALAEAGLFHEERLIQALVYHIRERVYEYARQRQHLETSDAALNLIASLRKGDQSNSVFEARSPSHDSIKPIETTNVDHLEV
jgi:glycosyltransferase involved in cell wall biosynthesis